MTSAAVPSQPNPFIEHPAEFKDSSLPDHDYQHVQYLFRFVNGRGASVIRGSHTYGGKAGQWELAVLDDTGDLDYSTPVTDDVLGWLSVADVRSALTRIAELPAAGHAGGVA